MGRCSGRDRRRCGDGDGMPPHESAGGFVSLSPGRRVFCTVANRMRSALRETRVGPARREALLLAAQLAADTRHLRTVPRLLTGESPRVRGPRPATAPLGAPPASGASARPGDRYRGPRSWGSAAPAALRTQAKRQAGRQDAPPRPRQKGPKSALAGPWSAIPGRWTHRTSDPKAARPSGFEPRSPHHRAGLSGAGEACARSLPRALGGAERAQSVGDAASRRRATGWSSRTPCRPRTV